MSPEIKDFFMVLATLDKNGGSLDGLEAFLPEYETDPEKIVAHFCTRVCAKFSEIITGEKELEILDYEALFSMKRWIDVCFFLSGYGTSDHFLKKFSDKKDILKLLLSLNSHSKIKLDWDEAFETFPEGAVLAALQNCASRFVFDEEAFKLREELLEWLPEKIDKVQLGAAALTRVAENYMHCSYAFTEKKHGIKKSLNKQMKRIALANGAVERFDKEWENGPNGKPILFIISELFSINHATWRTHSKAMLSLKEKFWTIGIGSPSPGPEEYYDEVIKTNENDTWKQTKFFSEEIAKRKPAAIFYVGVGMASLSIALSNLRLAPLQFVSFGHTASTFSEEIDWFILPEDFIETKNYKLFSERLCLVQKDAMPMSCIPEVKYNSIAGCGRVAISASVMKLNPVFFETLGEIKKRVPGVFFEFFAYGAKGLGYFYLKKNLEKYLPSFKIWPESTPDVYLERLSHCDAFLSPFPYGNMNSIIDCFRLQIPGVCMTGKEPHSKADGALFLRADLTDELITKDKDEYINAAVDLISNKYWIHWDGQALSMNEDRLQRADLNKTFFSGNSSLFCDAVWKLFNEISPSH